ncbi:hypothetical protein C8F04DRAFT_1186525 [Mycena alexandri]|uniref:Uncharacterized protein n=1 Tax=Mycena alexandri TaxID=1745969 RepID=A0AAD6SPC7_9AGAR|nr:hypothetical protein C8F04DRAFT_1186525 [Mycena alexandri]
MYGPASPTAGDCTKADIRLSLPHLGQGSAVSASYKVHARARSALACSPVFSALMLTTEPHVPPRARHCDCSCRPSHHAVLNEEEHLCEQEEWILKAKKNPSQASNEAENSGADEAIVQPNLGEVANMRHQADCLRWSEMSRLPYWNPTFQLTVLSEFLHGALEGVPVAALEITMDAAGIANDRSPACPSDFAEFDPDNSLVVRDAWVRAGDTPAGIKVCCSKEEAASAGIGGHGRDKGSDRLAIDHHHDSPPSVDRSRRWGNFPDPRTGIKTRKWLNAGLTRLLGHHFTPIIAIHPPASLTASTLAPNARWLTLPRVPRKSSKPVSPVLLELSGLPHDPAALFFSQNHDPHLSLPEGVGEFSIAKALDGANSTQNSFNDPRAPSRAHKALQAPAPLLPAAQTSRGQCPASLSCFFREEFLLLLQQIFPYAGNLAWKSSKRLLRSPGTARESLSSIASYPSRPTLTRTMDYIPPLLLSKPIFITLKIEYKPTGPCGPGNGRGPAYPFAPHSPTRARALPEMFLTVRHPGPLHPPRAPTPDVLETDGIEVPECEPLVHLDGVSDSLDLSLSTSLSTPHHRPPSRPAPFPLTHPTTFEFAVHARRPSGRRRSESRSPASAPPIKARSRGPLTPTSFDL